MGHYETALVCTNGHMIVSSLERSPELASRHCTSCGAGTISKCPSCHHNIRGNYHVEGVLAVGFETPVPSFCHDCGKPYPWTKSKLRAAADLADEMDELSEEDRAKLKGTLDDLVKDTAQTEVAALRFKKIMGKAGKGAAAAMREILVNVVSEGAKKALFG